MEKGSLEEEFNRFITELESRLNKINIDLEDYLVDHVCYRVSSTSEYQVLFDMFREESVLYTTKHFHERKFHLFVLKDSLKHKSISVPYLEFSEPGGSDDYSTGFQHLEFHSNLAVMDLIKGNPAGEELLYISKHGDEEYLKWPDKICLKVTAVPIITKSLLEDNPEIFLT